MESPKNDSSKLPSMVECRSMCGDHPSFTKKELNVKEEKTVDKQDKEKKERSPLSYTRISPSTSRTDRVALEQKSLAISEHALRLIEARKHVRSLEVVSRHDDINAPANRALVQAALGSFRWPPYLVAVWVLVLLLTHVLHCIVTMLERALPAIKKFCVYFRTWTEDSWHGETDSPHRLCPLALGAVTGLLYAAYYGLYSVYVIALWAIEPLCAEDGREDETKVTNYDDEIAGKPNSCLNK